MEKKYIYIKMATTNIADFSTSRVDCMLYSDII